MSHPLLRGDRFTSSFTLYNPKIEWPLYTENAEEDKKLPKLSTKRALPEKTSVTLPKRKESAEKLKKEDM